jgi:hypothetical protein
MTKPINAVLQKEMSRKEFLATLGLGVASVMGLSTIVRVLTGKSISGQLGHHQSQAIGYGGGTYGGTKKGA